MNYPPYYKEHMRLAILRLLSEVPNYRLNSSTVREGLKAWAFTTSQASFMAELQFLAQSGLIILEDNPIKPSIKIISITECGLDVAQGHIIFEGVAKPSPK